jgi:hypothetical protein
MKILEFTNLSGESSAQLAEHIVRVFEEAKLIDKVVSLSADSTNANFSGTKRRGKNKVFEMLINKIKRDITGWGLRNTYSLKCHVDSSRLFTGGHGECCRLISAFPHLYCACSNTEGFL